MFFKKVFPQSYTLYFISIEFFNQVKAISFFTGLQIDY